jgi:hypothetical protein
METKLSLMTTARDLLLKRATDAEKDCATLALRLCGEDEETFAPETREVMDRWRPKVLEQQAATPGSTGPTPPPGKGPTINTWDIVITTTDGRTLTLENIPDAIIDAVDKAIISRFPISWDPETDRGR